MCTFSKSMSIRLLSSLQVYLSTQRRVSVRNIVRDSTGFRSIPTKDHLGDTCERVQRNNLIRTVSSQVQRHRTHVPSRAMCRVAPVPTVIRFCTHLTPIWPQANAHVGLAFGTEQCPNKFTGLQHQMRMNELPQVIFYINTPLGDDVCSDFISVLHH